MAENMAAQVERPFPRLSRQGNIAYEVIENPREELAAAGVPRAQFQNICGGGIRFGSGEPVLPGTFLAVRIELPDLPDSILALGRVVTCAPPPRTERRSEVSVEFFWTGWGAPEVESTIHRYVRERV